MANDFILIMPPTLWQEATGIPATSYYRAATGTYFYLRNGQAHPIGRAALLDLLVAEAEAYNNAEVERLCEGLAAAGLMSGFLRSLVDHSTHNPDYRLGRETGAGAGPSAGMAVAGMLAALGSATLPACLPAAAGTAD
jgi:hypothetical protein